MKRSLFTSLLFILAVLLGAAYLVVGIPAKKARELWRQGKYAAAAEAAEGWAKLRLRPAEYETLLAASYLGEGRLGAAKPYLERLSKRERQWFPILSKEEIAAALVARGRYVELTELDSNLHQWREGDDLPLYRAAAQLGVGNLALAERQFRDLAKDDLDAKKYEALRVALEERRKGSISLLLDRGGEPIASYQLRNRDLVTLNRDFASLIDSEAGPLTIESQLAVIGTTATIETTLDRDLQKAALFALGGFRGSIVVIDIASNEILVAASNPGEGASRNLAFEAMHEPGSVVKVLTGIASYEAGIVDPLFPMQCDGFLQIDGRMFYDWARHDRLEALPDAMATSCNVAFARLGEKLGSEKVEQFLRRSGFGSKADIGLYDVPLGSVSGPFANHYSLANASVGLVHQRINALHLAMLARAAATGGELAPPTIVRSRRTILGDELPRSKKKATQIAPVEAVRKIWPSMQAVVTNPRGTGRRAAVPGLTIALKTGTSGSRNPAYDSLIMAFAPADKPKVAVAIIAEHSGPAELAGAKIAHDFFAQLQQRMPK